MSEKKDIFQQAEEVIENASRSYPDTEKRKNTAEEYYYFMGGAYAGEILTKVDKVTDVSGVNQIHLEYLTDRQDLGDLGDLFNHIRAEAFSIEVPKTSDSQNIPQFDSFPDNRIFFIKDGSLYVSNKQGLIAPEKQRGVAVQYPRRVTDNSDVAQELFDKISALPISSRGRDLFALLLSAIEAYPEEIELQYVDLSETLLDLEGEELEEQIMLLHTKNEDEEDRLRQWFIHFKGKIPFKWRNWYSIIEDLDTKGKDTPQIWVDAAVTHSDKRVVASACKNCPLNQEQMAIAFANIGLGWWKTDEIEQALRDQNLSELTIQTAIQLASKEGTSLIDSKLNS
jgi:hypothetical protein